MTFPEGQPNPWSREGADLPYYPPPPPPPPPPQRLRRVPWVVLISLSVLILGLIVWGSIAEGLMGAFNEPADPGPSTKPQVVTATDDKSQLTVPDSWRPISGTFKNDLAVLQLGDRFAEQYVLVISAEKADFDDLDGFAEACLTDVDSMDTPDVGAERRLTVGGLPAVQHVINARVQGIKVVFWYTMVDGAHGYYLVVGWTLPSRQATAEPVISGVIGSFHELG